MGRIVLSFCNSTKAFFVINVYTYVFMFIGFAAPYTLLAKAASGACESKSIRPTRITESGTEKAVEKSVDNGIKITNKNKDKDEDRSKDKDEDRSKDKNENKSKDKKHTKEHDKKQSSQLVKQENQKLIQKEDAQEDKKKVSKNEKKHSSKHDNEKVDKVLKEVTQIDKEIRQVEDKVEEIGDELDIVGDMVKYIKDKIGRCKGATICAVLDESKKELNDIGREVENIEHIIKALDQKINTSNFEVEEIEKIEKITKEINKKIGHCDDESVCSMLKESQSMVASIGYDVEKIKEKITRINREAEQIAIIEKTVSQINYEVKKIDEKVVHIDQEIVNISDVVIQISDKIGDCGCDETICSIVKDSQENIEAIKELIGDCILCDRLSILDSKIDVLNPGVNCCSTIDVINSKIDAIVGAGICGLTVINGTTVISSPGNYCVANSFNGSIIISSNDVYLDLNERTVSNNRGNAVEILTGCEQVTVTNGCVTGSPNGVQVNSACSRITISNVVAAGCVQGIELDGVGPSKIIECDMISNVIGLQINDSSKIRVIDCTSQCNAQAGIALYNSTDCCVTGCKAVANGAGTAGIDTYGIVLDSGSCNIIEKCIVVDTEIVGVTPTCPPDCFVPYMDPLVIQDCTISTTVSVVRGIALLNSEQNSKIIDCEVGCTQAGVSCCEYERILSPNSIQALGIALDESAAVSSAPATLDLVISSTGTSIFSVAWLVNNGVNYLATAGHANKVEIFSFDPNLMSLQQAASISVPNFNVFSDSWLVCDGNNYLAVGDASGVVNILQFNPALNSLTSVTEETIAPEQAIFSIAWLVADGNNYLATGGEGENDIIILKFDQALNSLTTVTQNPGFFDPMSSGVSSVAWLVSDGNNYLAIGGSISSEVGVVKIFEFIPTSSRLNLIATSSSIIGNNFFGPYPTVWLVCNDANYLATGGLDLFGNEVIQILDFNIAASSLTEVASFTVNNGGATNGLAWFVCGGTHYLAAGNTPANVRIFEFDATSTTSLSQVITTSLDTTSINSVAWLVSDGLAYLAAAGNMPNSLNILNFGCGAQGVLPQNNIIKNNLVYDTDGVGINGSTASNFIVGNTAYNNNPNYGSDVAEEYVFSGGITAILSNPFLNSSF